MPPHGGRRRIFRWAAIGQGSVAGMASGARLVASHIAPQPLHRYLPVIQNMPVPYAAAANPSIQTIARSSSSR